MNEKIKTPEEVLPEMEKPSIYDEQIFDRKFKDGDQLNQCFLIKSRQFQIDSFDKAKFKIIVENRGSIAFEHADDERNAIEKFKIRVFEAFQRVDFLQMYVSDLLTSESERVVYFIKDNQIEWKFAAILEKSNQTEKS